MASQEVLSCLILTGKSIRFNRKESTARFAPASTYKVFSALLALESGIITKNNSQMTWDGTQYPYKEWNQDQDLFSAMSSSATWYFQKLDRQIGEDHLRRLSQIYPLWK